MGQLFLDGAPGARIGASEQRLEGAVAIAREIADNAHKALKGLVAGDKISLGIDLDQSAGGVERAAGSAHGGADQPLGGHPPGLFGRRRQPLLAQPVDRRFEIAAAVAERALAVHHAGAGLVAQLLDQRRGHLGHLSYPLSVAARCSRAGAQIVAALSRP